MILLSALRESFARAFSLPGIGFRMPESLRARRVVVSASIVAGSVLAAASIFATSPSAAPEIPEEKAWPVSFVTVSPSALSPMFNAFGRVESTQVARIQSDLVAEVATVAVREGQWVTRGDVLVTLEDEKFLLAAREHDAEVAREHALLERILTEERLTKESSGHYRSMYDIANKKLARHEDLVAKRMISQALLDEVREQSNAAAIAYQDHRLAIADFPNRVAEQKARVAQSEALRDRARLDLENTTLRAPFTGPVLRVAAAPGNHTVLGQPLVEIANSEGLEVRAPVPDAYAGAVRRHLSESTRMSARTHLGDTDAVLVLARLGGSVRSGQSGVDAFFRVESAHAAPLEIGRVLNLAVTLPPEGGVVALPVQSIYENDRVYSLEDDRLKAITVERVGDHQTDEGAHRVLVRSPELLTGVRIITTQLPKAIGGLRVAPVG